MLKNNIFGCYFNIWLFGWQNLYSIEIQNKLDIDIQSDSFTKLQKEDWVFLINISWSNNLPKLTFSIEVKTFRSNWLNINKVKYNTYRYSKLSLPLVIFLRWDGMFSFQVLLSIHLFRGTFTLVVWQMQVNKKW